MNTCIPKYRHLMILQEQVDVRDVDPDGVDVDDGRHVQDLLLLPEEHAGTVLHLRIPPGLSCFVPMLQIRIMQMKVSKKIFFS